MADNPFIEFGNSHPYLKHRDDLADKNYAAVLVDAIFQEIKLRFGEEAAVKMFAAHVRTINNKDKTVWKNARLILQLCYMDKPNISELARKLAGKDKNNAARVEAWRQQISEARRDKKAIATAREFWEETNDAKFDDYFRPPKRKRHKPIVR